MSRNMDEVVSEDVRLVRGEHGLRLEVEKDGQWVLIGNAGITYLWTLVTIGRLVAQVAALTAERDEARRIHVANVEAGIELAKDFNRAGGVGYEVDGVFIRARALLGEVVALRERVKALEGMHDAAERRVDVLQSNLAAILQRVGDADGVSKFIRNWEREQDGGEWELERLGKAVARYIVGDEATEPCPCGAREGERHRALPPENHEPTTAEAFAKLRTHAEELREADLRKSAELVLEQLSLLERRMGAMGRLTALVDAYVNRGGLLEDVRSALPAALTDAPSVFTLEEVEALCKETVAAERGDWDDEGQPAKVLDGVAYELRTRLERLAAQRKTGR